MSPLRIAMVGYLNTLPFEYGLKRLSRFLPLQLILDTPARCAQHFSDGTADVALVPVGALPALPDHEVILDYCIGCDGPVKTVCLLSHTEPKDWQLVWLDTHSRTSRLLTQIVVNQHLELAVDYADLRVSNMSPLTTGEAVLMIGDKVFEQADSYPYRLDLGTVWQEMTGLPFVFAVWVKRKGLDVDTDLLNDALARGIDKIPDLVRAHADASSLTLAEVDRYITENLRYDFGDRQRSGLQQFKELVSGGQWL